MLNTGDEVTVDGEFYFKDQPRPEINKESYWAVVTGRVGGDYYEVEDKDGKASTVERGSLRLRTRHTICSAHVSDDKNMIVLQCNIFHQPSSNGWKDT